MKTDKTFVQTKNAKQDLLISCFIKQNYLDEAIAGYEAQNGKINSKLLKASLKTDLDDLSLCYLMNGKVIGFLHALKCPIEVLKTFDPIKTETDEVLAKIKDYHPENNDGNSKYAIFIPFIYLNPKFKQKAVLKEMHRNLGGMIAFNASDKRDLGLTGREFATHVFCCPISSSIEERDYCNYLTGNLNGFISESYNTGYSGILDLSSFNNVNTYKELIAAYKKACCNQNSSLSTKKKK